MLSYMNELVEVKARMCDDMEWNIHSLLMGGDNVRKMLRIFAT